MKDKSFLIKISDLLTETGKSDEIAFDHKVVEQLPNVMDEGIAGTLTIQSVGSDSLLGTLHDVTCRIEDPCDSCGKPFIREVHVPEYTARFVATGSLTKEEEESSEEAILFINDKDDTIDISDMVYQAIMLDDPFVKRCAACEKRLAATEDDDEDLGNFTSAGNISFS
ncbi:MAG: YceD family protein [bacterium]